jgi:5-hydroxyisourate hydrolase-like protein (transthyretin family)
MLRLALMLLLLQGAPAAQERGVVLQGIVLKMGTGEPVPKATVTLSRFEGRGGNSYAATTNSGGQFLFQNIEPGQYRLSATRNGYVRSEYGARSPNRPGLPITVSPGQRLPDLVLQIMPAGTITGRVFDRDGEPLANVTVQALKYSYQEGQRQLNSVQQARTNDLGEYRLFWVQPGQYFVSATRDNRENFGGRGGGARVAGPGAVFTGRGMAVPPLSADGEAEEGYVPVYYPGTTDVQSAAPISVPAGTVFSGVDLTVASVRTVRVRGRVINSSTGQPAQNANVTLFAKGVRLRGGFGNSRVMDQQGGFEIRGVTPGSYDLVAVLNDPRNRMNLTARVPLEIGNADVDNVALVVSPGLAIPGKLIIEGTSSNSGDQDPRRMRLMLRPNGGIQLAPSPAAPVQPDGSFTLQSVQLDSYRLSVTGMPQNAYVKTARLGATDVLNEGLRIERQPAGVLEVVVSLNSGSLEGSVLNEKQEPSANVTIVLVPDAAHRHRMDLYRTASSDALGRFKIQGIPPGDYKAFAWEDIESGAWQDPDFMRQFEDRGKSVRTGEGGQTNIELRVIPSQM